MHSTVGRNVNFPCKNNLWIWIFNHCAMLPSSFFKTIHCNQFLIPNKMKRSHLKVGEKDWGKFLKGWNFAWKISNHLIKSHFGEIVISGYGKIDGHCLHYHASTCWKWWIIFHVSTIHLKKWEQMTQKCNFRQAFSFMRHETSCLLLLGWKKIRSREWSLEEDIQFDNDTSVSD